MLVFFIVLVYVTAVMGRAKDIATSDRGNMQQLRSEVDDRVLPKHCKFVDFNKDKDWLDFYVPKLTFAITREGWFRDMLMKDFSPMVGKNEDTPGAPMHVDRFSVNIPGVGEYEMILNYIESRTYNLKSYHGSGFKTIPGVSNELLMNVEFDDLLIESDIHVQFGKKTNGFLAKIICFFYLFDFCTTGELQDVNIKAELRMPHVEGRGRLRLDVVDSTNAFPHRVQAVWDTAATFITRGADGISDQIMSNIYDAEMLEATLKYNTIHSRAALADDPFSDFKDSAERRKVVEFITKSAQFASAHFFPKETRKALERVVLDAMNDGVAYNRPKFWKQYQIDHKRPLQI